MRKKPAYLCFALAPAIACLLWQAQPGDTGATGSGGTTAAPSPAAKAPEAAVGQGKRDFTFKVVRSGFDISFTVSGQLDACQHCRIFYPLEAKFGLTIAEIARPSAKVKAGEVVVRFFADAYTEERDKFQAELNEKRKACENLVNAANVDLEDALGKFEARRAEERMALAQKQEVEQAKCDEALAANAKESRDAQDNYTLFISDFDAYLDTLRNNMKNCLNAIKTANDDYESYLNNDSEERKATLRNDILKAESDHSTTTKGVSDKQNEIDSAGYSKKATVAKLTEEIAKLQKQSDSEVEALALKRRALRKFTQVEYTKELAKRDMQRIQTKRALKDFIARESQNLAARLRRGRDLRANIERLNVRQPAEIKRKRDENNQREADNTQKRIEAINVEEENKRKATTLACQQAKESFDREAARLEKAIAAMKDEINALTLRAPIDGIVNIIQPAEGPYMAGSKVQRGAVIATIPDLSSFHVLCDVPECYRSRLTVGMKTALRSAALPGEALSGTLTEISPTSQFLVRWDKNSPKVYPVIINTATSSKALMPGMSVEAEFQLESVRDALCLPIEAVHARGEERFCTVVASGGGEEERAIKTGRLSSSMVEVLSGLSEGEYVRLDNPLADTKE